MGDAKEENIELKLDTSGALSKNQKAGIYNNYLSSLKGQIVEFMFIDDKMAIELMQAYNELLSQIDTDGTLSFDMLKKLNDLEARVAKAKGESLKQSSENVTAFESKCVSLLEELNQDTIEKTEEGLRNLRAILESGNSTYTLEQRSQIQNLLSNLHFHIIKEKVRGGSPDLDLKEEIPKAEQAEMKVAMYYQAARLLNNSDNRKKEFGQKIKTSMQLYSQTPEAMQMLYDKSIWENFVQADGKTQQMTKTKSEQSNSLALVPQKQGIFQRLGNLFRKRTEIEKIADEVVTSEMLEKFIDHSVPQSQRYIPDKKLPVYLFLQQLEQLSRQEEQSISFPCRATNGVIYECRIDGKERRDIYDPNVKDLYIKFQNENERQLSRKDVSCYVEDNPILLIQFAEFLGYGEEFAQQVGQFYYNEPKKGNVYRLEYEKFAQQVYLRLQKALKEYKNTKDRFFFEENDKREQASSKRKQFVEELRVSGGEMQQLRERTEEQPQVEREEGKNR